MLSIFRIKNKRNIFLPSSLISLGAVEELSHPVLPQYFSDVWQVFLQVFVDK